MLTKSILSGVRSALSESRRGFGIMVPAMQKATDPIQQLFLEKLREYGSKSKNGDLVDATPEIKAELKSELERIAKQFGGGAGVDMTKFPEFKWTEPKLDPINQSE